MLKIIAAGVTALFVTAAPLAYAEQATSQGRLSAADLENLTDARIEIVKAALQLTPDQEKLWPPIEDAIRARAKDRQARIAIAVERARELRDRSRIEVLRDRNPIEFMKRRADRLAQRSADLKRLAEAWEPLYQTLTPEQKRRMAFLAIIAVREMRDAVEERRVRSEDETTKSKARPFPSPTFSTRGLRQRFWWGEGVRKRVASKGRVGNSPVV